MGDAVQRLQDFSKSKQTHSFTPTETLQQLLSLHANPLIQDDDLSESAQERSCESEWGDSDLLSPISYISTRKHTRHLEKIYFEEIETFEHVLSTLNS